MLSPKFITLMTVLTLLLPLSISAAEEITDPILGEIRYAGYTAFEPPDQITHDTGIFVINPNHVPIKVKLEVFNSSGKSYGMMKLKKMAPAKSPPFVTKSEIQPNGLLWHSIGMFIAKKKPGIIQDPSVSPRPHIKYPFRIVVYGNPGEVKRAPIVEVKEVIFQGPLEISQNTCPLIQNPSQILSWSETHLGGTGISDSGDGYYSAYCDPIAEKQRQVKTWFGTIRTHLESYRAENDTYACPDFENLTWVEKMECIGVEGVPETDPWGTAWEYETDIITFSIKSYGSDGLPGPLSYPDPWLIGQCAECDMFIDETHPYGGLPQEP